MKPIDISQVEKSGISLYEAVLMMAKRARQIHEKESEKFKNELGEMEDEKDFDDANIDREKIAIKFDKKPKPTQVSMHELLNGELKSKLKKENQDL